MSQPIDLDHSPYRHEDAKQDERSRTGDQCQEGGRDDMQKFPPPRHRTMLSDYEVQLLTIPLHHATLPLISGVAALFAFILSGQHMDKAMSVRISL